MVKFAYTINEKLQYNSQIAGFSFLGGVLATYIGAVALALPLAGLWVVAEQQKSNLEQKIEALAQYEVSQTQRYLQQVKV